MKYIGTLEAYPFNLLRASMGFETLFKTFSAYCAFFRIIIPPESILIRIRRQRVKLMHYLRNFQNDKRQFFALSKSLSPHIEISVYTVDKSMVQLKIFLFILTILPCRRHNFKVCHQFS